MDKHKVLLKFFEVMEALRENNNSKNSLSEDFKKRLKKDRIPHSGRTLLGVLQHNGSLNQRSIAKEMNISSQAVCEIVKKLEQGGYITKTCGVQNNENIIALTDFGLEIAKELEKRLKESCNKFFSKLTDEENETMYNLLSKLIEK